MLRRIVLLAVSVLALACLSTMPTLAQPQPQTEPRIAFVVGNSAYRAGAVPAALNDAGLVAEALRSIGFEIVEGADLTQPELLRSYREFLGKVEAAGPDTLAFVYFSGDGVSFEGENVLLGVDDKLVRDIDIPIEGVRLNDLLQSLANSPARAKVMMIDAARPIPFKPQGKPLARGLEAIDPPQGVLLAYSSAPGTLAPDRPGDYGAYATAIAEMLRAPGIDLDTAFTHIRSRTHVASDGQQTPWHVSAIAEPIELVPSTAATASVPPPPPVRQARPMREIGPEEAYALAIEMDTLEGYVQFVEAYPGHPLTRRVWAMIRARREALAWMRALETNTPRAYWTYMRRYPHGMYLADAERRLRRLRQPFAPPPGFVMMDFDDVPMALAGEPVEYEEVYEVGPPPPRLVYAAPPPGYLAHLPPPRHRGSGAAAVLPALAIAIPVVAALAPAPHRTFAPGTGPGARSGAFGRHRGARSTPASTAPAAAAPAVAPTATAPTVSPPKTSTAPSVVTPSPGQNRPPGWQRGPGQGRTPPPGVANRTPPAAPTAPAAAPNSAAPNTAAPTSPSNSTAPAAPAHSSTSPPSRGHRGPPPGIANRTPPSTPGAAPSAAAPNHQPPPHGPRPPGVGQPPPQHSVARPTPPAAPPAARPAPPRPPTPPAQAAAKPAPPKPPPPAPAKPAPKPACPAGKTLQNGACK